MTDPYEELANRAQQKVIEAGMAGRELRDAVDANTVVLATWSWGLKAIRKVIADGNEDLLKRFQPNNDTKRAKVIRHAPAAGFGLGIGGIIAFLRELVIKP